MYQFLIKMKGVFESKCTLLELLEYLLQEIELFPIETLGIQSVFCTLFSFSHNGGTWFVSCILICYSLFPVMFYLCREISDRNKIVLIAVFVFILLYSPIVVYLFKLSSIYSSPFFRFMEFSIGCLLSSLLINPIDFSVRRIKFLSSPLAFIFELFLLITGMTVASGILRIGVGNYMLYSWIALPCFIFMVVTLSSVSPAFIEKSRVVSYLCSISYVFFLAQFFTWRPVAFILMKIGLYDVNLVKILVSFILCLLISIFLHEFIEKPLKYFFSVKLHLR